MTTPTQRPASNSNAARRHRENVAATGRAMSPAEEFAVVIAALLAGRIDGQQAITSCVAVHECLAALSDALGNDRRATGPWIAFPGKVPVCRDCGTDWQPVRRGECIACGSDAGPLPIMEARP